MPKSIDTALEAAFAAAARKAIAFHKDAFTKADKSESTEVTAARDAYTNALEALS